MSPQQYEVRKWRLKTRITRKAAECLQLTHRPQGTAILQNRNRYSRPSPTNSTTWTMKPEHTVPRFGPRNWRARNDLRGANKIFIKRFIFVTSNNKFISSDKITAISTSNCFLLCIRTTPNQQWFLSDLTLIALMMEAVRTSETLVNLNQTTRRYNQEDSHPRALSCSYTITDNARTCTPTHARDFYASFNRLQRHPHVSTAINEIIQDLSHSP
jgi:hypothetical protein